MSTINSNEESNGESSEEDISVQEVSVQKKKKLKKVNNNTSQSRSRSKSWSLAELMFLVKAHHKASCTWKGTNQKAEEFWESVSMYLASLKENCFLNHVDDKEYWEPKCELRTREKCKVKYNKIQTDIQRFISLLETDKKLQGGKEGATGEDRCKWYTRINKLFVLRNKKSCQFRLYSFEEHLENEHIDIPKYCMNNHPKFNDLATMEADLVVVDSGSGEENVSITASPSDSSLSAMTRKKIKKKRSQAAKVFDRPIGRNAARAADVNMNPPVEDKFYQAMSQQMMAQTQMMGSFLEAQTKKNNATTSIEIINKLTDLIKERASASPADQVIYDESIKTLREMLSKGNEI